MSNTPDGKVGTPAVEAGLEHFLINHINFQSLRCIIPCLQLGPVFHLARMLAISDAIAA